MAMTREEALKRIADKLGGVNPENLACLGSAAQTGHLSLEDYEAFKLVMTGFREMFAPRV